jgi:formate/nitrite transporter FocA (FNT family)
MEQQTKTQEAQSPQSSAEQQHPQDGRQEGQEGAQTGQSNGPAYKSDQVHPKLNQEEQKEVEERSTPSAQVVYGAIQKEGEEELERPSSALAWSGLAAGLSMGFSFVAETLLRTALPDEPWRPLIAKLGYSLGLLIVILGRQQLFTENTLTPILPLLSRRTTNVLANVLRLWAVVLITNLVGALVFSWVLGNTGVFKPEVQTAFSDVGREALRVDFWSALIRGVFAGWLIALMVWLLPAAETARLWIIIIITYMVGLGGLTHIIAGSTETFYLGVTEQAAWGDILSRYTLPTLIGNIVGGVTLVAVFNHAQVVSGK